MIQSMTGFGKVTIELPTKKVTVEIKALNSKQLDLSVRIPSVYKEKEMEIRSMTMKALTRGKVDLSVFIENIGKHSTSVINQEIVMDYYDQLKALSERMGLPVPANWGEAKSLLRFPDVMMAQREELDEEEWGAIKQALTDALAKLVEFRVQEGEMLRKLFVEKIKAIGQYLVEVEPFETQRVEKIKTRILDNLERIGLKDYDKNRFEQEMIYYIEKLDINEEKTRLDNHLKYFISTMDEESAQGKKLGFIVQEMGREINTLGSKSNQAEMQRVVVKMKDELEQIKEQILNVL